MKRYKLIKRYPGCPNFGEIAEKYGNRYNILNYNDECGDVIQDCNIVENYPEFWEEIVEKEYEILSFIKEKSDDYLLYFKTKGYKSKFGDREVPLDEMLNSQHYKIRSIKRLKDGEVFIVGDKTTEGIISEFKIDSFNSLLFQVPILNIGHSWMCIADAKKAKTPLFTTEDGVDIFEGDLYWYVHSLTFELRKMFNSNYNSDNLYSNKLLKFFSTKEAAEEYILMNKPCLSIKDIDSINTYTSERLQISRSVLKNLVKSKL